jgi:CBS domain-containing protein
LTGKTRPPDALTFACGNEPVRGNDKIEPTIQKDAPMAQTPDTKTTSPDSNAQSATERSVQAAANQTIAAENAAISSVQTTARQGSEAARQATGEVGEAMRRTGAAAAEATQLTTEVAAETARRATDKLAEGQRTLIEEMARHFETLGRQMATTVQESASDLRTFVVPPQHTSENLRDLQEGISSLVSGVVQSNVRMTQELLQMANPASVFNLQRRFMRDYMDALLQGSSAIMRVAQKSANQTLQPIQERIEQRQHDQHGGSNGHRPVVSDVMTAGVRLITPEDTVQQATRMMRDEDTGVLPVGEGDRLVGIVTDRDVTTRVVAEGKDPQRTKVREVMSQEPKYVFEDEDLEHVADNMAQQQLRRLPVVNRNKRLVGVVSIGDLARGDRSGRYAGKAMRGVIRAAGAQEARSAAE